MQTRAIMLDVCHMETNTDKVKKKKNHTYIEKPAKQTKLLTLPGFFFFTLVKCIAQQ